MSDWQPIETAPKDGTEVLLWSKGGSVTIGHWRDVLGIEDWWESGCEYSCHEPTHWMPLPEPPTS